MEPPENIPSFLIVDHEVDQAKKWIVAEAITSKRIGKLVIIVQPGNVSRIPESVRGAITNSFNDEWPWKLDGELSAFSFKNVLLPALIENGFSSSSLSEKKALKQLIGDTIVDALSDSLDGHQILFDYIFS